MLGSYQYLIIGGKTTEIIDLGNPNKTSIIGELPSKREGAVIGLLGSTPIICGGKDHNDWYSSNSTLNKCISFKQSHWTSTHTMTRDRIDAASVQLNDTMWILGGWYYHCVSRCLSGADGTTSSTEFLKMNTNKGIPGPDLPYWGYGHCAVKFSEEQVFVIGGFQTLTGFNIKLSSNVVIFNPLNNFTYIEGPSLNEGRSRHVCGLMSNGQLSKIVIAGGIREKHDVEIFDPSINSWCPGMKYILEMEIKCITHIPT